LWVGILEVLNAQQISYGCTLVDTATDRKKVSRGSAAQGTHCHIMAITRSSWPAAHLLKPDQSPHATHMINSDTSPAAPPRSLAKLRVVTCELPSHQPFDDGHGFPPLGIRPNAMRTPHEHSSSFKDSCRMGRWLCRREDRSSEGHHQDGSVRQFHGRHNSSAADKVQRPTVGSLMGRCHDEKSALSSCILLLLSSGTSWRELV
jgi:hypothetical protein